MPTFRSASPGRSGNYRPGRPLSRPPPHKPRLFTKAGLGRFFGRYWCLVLRPPNRKAAGDASGIIDRRCGKERQTSTEPQFLPWPGTNKTPTHIPYGTHADVLVRATGVEPARLATLEPKSSASANSAMPAYIAVPLQRSAVRPLPSLEWERDLVYHTFDRVATPSERQNGRKTRFFCGFVFFCPAPSAREEVWSRYSGRRNRAERGEPRRRTSGLRGSRPCVHIRGAVRDKYVERVDFLRAI